MLLDEQNCEQLDKKQIFKNLMDKLILNADDDYIENLEQSAKNNEKLFETRENEHFARYMKECYVYKEPEKKPKNQKEIEAEEKKAAIAAAELEKAYDSLNTTDCNFKIDLDVKAHPKIDLTPDLKMIAGIDRGEKPFITKIKNFKIPKVNLRYDLTNIDLVAETAGKITKIFVNYSELASLTKRTVEGQKLLEILNKWKRQDIPNQGYTHTCQIGDFNDALNLLDFLMAEEMQFAQEIRMNDAIKKETASELSNIFNIKNLNLPKKNPLGNILGTDANTFKKMIGVKPWEKEDAKPRKNFCSICFQEQLEDNNVCSKCKVEVGLLNRGSTYETAAVYDLLDETIRNDKNTLAASFDEQMKSFRELEAMGVCSIKINPPLPIETDCFGYESQLKPVETINVYSRLST